MFLLTFHKNNWIFQRFCLVSIEIIGIFNVLAYFAWKVLELLYFAMSGAGGDAGVEDLLSIFLLRYLLKA